ncbi:Calcium-binding EF-hand family protein [Abeliophyllum distichum]|uniref:Calcium-binding EF-hand family protein n=1 Tax=Abeliophyllum distichum TaxID=126358 RepID=A0ABD1UPI6_9LAMI
MSVAFVDAPTVVQFVNDFEVFNKWVNNRFDMLDADGNGVLSRDELQKRFGKFSSKEFELQSKEEIENLYDVLFENFDVDKSGTIDRKGFIVLMKEIMLAKARGIGNLPIPVILQGDSLLMRAIQHASSLK